MSAIFEAVDIDGKDVQASPNLVGGVNLEVDVFDSDGSWDQMGTVSLTADATAALVLPTVERVEVKTRVEFRSSTSLVAVHRYPIRPVRVEIKFYGEPLALAACLLAAADEAEGVGA